MKNALPLIAGFVLASGLAASPSFAQTFGSDGAGYNRDGTLNVWGAHIDPPLSRSGLLGGAGTVVGGAVGAADDIVTGSVTPRRNDRAARYGADDQTAETGVRDDRRRGGAF